MSTIFLRFCCELELDSLTTIVAGTWVYKSCSGWLHDRATVKQKNHRQLALSGGHRVSDELNQIRHVGFSGRPPSGLGRRVEGKRPRVTIALSGQATTCLGAALTPPAFARAVRALSFAFSLLLRPQCSRRAPTAPSSSAVVSRALRRTTTVSISPIAALHLPPPPRRVDCFYCALVRAYFLFPLPPEPRPPWPPPRQARHYSACARFPFDFER